MNCRTARQYVQRELDGELSTVERESLREHLSACGTCRAVHRQLVTMQTAMRQLAAESDRGCEELAPVAFGRPHSAGHGISWRTGLAAAAVIALCVGAWLASGFLPTKAAKSPQVVSNPPSRGAELRSPEPGTRTPAPEPRSDVRVTFASSSDVIAVPKPTKNPNVTVIWIYPTVKTAQASDDQKHGTSAPAERNQT